MILSTLILIPAMTQPVTLRSGMSITRSVKVKPGIYRLASKNDLGATGAISIKGNNITVDFAEVTLEGTPQTVEPDQRKGTGVVVEGKNITIKNLRCRGYKIGLIARNSPNIKIVDSDLSYNWKQRLLSTLEREDGADWMSYHRNEKDEWLRYGAGIYLRNCDGFEVRGTTIVGGQCGLMLMECDKGLAWNNNFSFLSAIGLGMYLSSGNRVMHNKIDWCVRGFSYGVYNRGQDSAGILVYEQSNKNVFAYNSATHGGDGFFLWAGQTTMDTGKGGCNDNLLYGNDFSHSPANGIEATFSRNNFVNNLLLECWHGIWGGYSYESKVIGNSFGYNQEAIAWEHGQDNLVAGNWFAKDNEGLVIWSNPTQDPNWGYAKHRDTRSRDWTIRDNWLTMVQANVFRIRRSENITIEGNTIMNSGRIGDIGAYVTGLRFNQNEGLARSAEPLIQGNPDFAIDAKFVPGEPASSLTPGEFRSKKLYLARFKHEAEDWHPLRNDPRKFLKGPQSLNPEETRLASAAPYYVKPLPGGLDPFLRSESLRGWRYMFVDEWGPYDFKRPILLPRGSKTVPSPGDRFEGRMAGPDETKLIFEVLGPPGRWRVVGPRSPSGFSKTSGQVGDMIEVAVASAGNVKLVFEYVGEKTTDYRGIVTEKGKPVRFGYEKFFAPIDWTINWYAWDKAEVASPKDKMPKPGRILSRTQIGKPNATLKADKLDFATSGSPAKGVPDNHFITLATGTFDIPAGDYVLNVTTDDGIRLWLDDKLLIDEWHWQGPTPYSRNVKLGGHHRLRVEHYEIDGYTALKVDIKRK